MKSHGYRKGSGTDLTGTARVAATNQTRVFQTPGLETLGDQRVVRGERSLVPSTAGSKFISGLHEWLSELGQHPVGRSLGRDGPDLWHDVGGLGSPRQSPGPGPLAVGRQGRGVEDHVSARAVEDGLKVWSVGLTGVVEGLVFVAVRLLTPVEPPPSLMPRTGTTRPSWSSSSPR